jgi:tetratricopeptide (TPR) repeat protein
MQCIRSAEVDEWLAMAAVRFRRNETCEAEALLRDARMSAPDREDVAFLLARVLRSQGRLSAAAETLLAVCGANDFETGLCVRCAEFARQCDRHVVAGKICEAALTTGVVTPELLALAGNVAREAGDFATARAHYLAALDTGIDLKTHYVFWALANTRRFTDPADTEIACFAGHFADARFSPRSRASAGFALAKAKNDLGDYESAAATLREANALVSMAQPWDREAWLRFIGARARERVNVASMSQSPRFVPVFIVGAPRTGTTLTATLLARATGARDRGELRTLRYIAQQLIDGDHLGSAAALVEAADLYRRLAVQDDAPTTWYLDQDPLNFRWLHIAAAMFPQARVIHLRRGLRDTALSLWGQDFAHPDLAFAYDFEAMHAFMRGHDELMSRWRLTLPIEVLDLDYEALVGDSDTEVEKLAAFIGAPLVHASAGTDTPVTSTSVWQARQPVYSTSVGRWRHYAPYVPELERFAGAT